MNLNSTQLEYLDKNARPKKRPNKTKLTVLALSNKFSN